MKRRIFTYLALAFAITACQEKELAVNDYSFRAIYTPADTTGWTHDQLLLLLSIDDYRAGEEISLQYRINNQLNDTLTINGNSTTEPYSFNPAIDKQLQIGFTPKHKGNNSICINLSNSRYATEANITVRAMEETTYNYDWKNYDMEITTVEGI